MSNKKIAIAHSDSTTFMKILFDEWNLVSRQNYKSSHNNYLLHKDAIKFIFNHSEEIL